MDSLNPMASDSDLLDDVILDKTVYISDLVRRLGGVRIIHDKQFLRCDLVGPAVIYQNDVIITNTTFVAPGMPIDSLVIGAGMNTAPMGIIELSECLIDHCRMYQIGFIVHSDAELKLRNALRTGSGYSPLPDVSETAPPSQDQQSTPDKSEGQP